MWIVMCVREYGGGRGKWGWLTEGPEYLMAPVAVVMVWFIVLKWQLRRRCPHSITNSTYSIYSLTERMVMLQMDAKSILNLSQWSSWTTYNYCQYYCYYYYYCCCCCHIHYPGTQAYTLPIKCKCVYSDTRRQRDE